MRFCEPEMENMLWKKKMGQKNFALRIKSIMDKIHKYLASVNNTYFLTACLVDENILANQLA